MKPVNILKDHVDEKVPNFDNNMLLYDLMT